MGAVQKTCLDGGVKGARSSMPNAEPHRLPATTLARLVDSGELTAEAVIQSCIERIRRPVDPAGALVGRGGVAGELCPVPPGGHAYEHRQPRYVRREGALGRGHRALPGGADGNPPRPPGDARAPAAPRFVPHDAL